MASPVLGAAIALGLAAGAPGCKSRASDQASRAAADAAAMPLNVRAELEALCEAASAVADPALRPSCSASEAPRNGAAEEVILRLNDDEGGVFLYYGTAATYAVARDAGHADPTGACDKTRIVWRLVRTKVPAAMTAPALSAVNAACDKQSPIP
jgi:CO/xanthine dehydrogenase FAD-binding subunit